MALDAADHCLPAARLHLFALLSPLAGPPTVLYLLNLCLTDLTAKFITGQTVTHANDAAGKKGETDGGGLPGFRAPGKPLCREFVRGRLPGRAVTRRRAAGGR